jgi:hypothetical protein
MSQEDWDSELLVPAQGRLVYMGQGQCHYVHFHQPTPQLLWPKKKKKKARPSASSNTSRASGGLGCRDRGIPAQRKLGCRDCGIPVKTNPFQGYPKRPFSGPPISSEKILSIYQAILTTRDFFFNVYFEQCSKQQRIYNIEPLQIEFMTSTNLSFVCSRFTESLFKLLLHIMISL